MRRQIDIDLNNRQITETNLVGRDIVDTGRYLIAKMLLASDTATIDPLGQDNPLIFSAGPFAGTNFSNANRLSVGCKSPLTGGIKEANSGGTFAFAMGQLEISRLVFHGCFDQWTIIYIPKEGPITYVDATNYLGLGNIECARKLHERYGVKISLALCGPVGEYQGLMAGISFSDTDNRPTRLAARGGVGAVMGTKKIKAVVIEKDKMPSFKDRRQVMQAVKNYGKLLDHSSAVQALKTTGTAMVGDLTNQLGALPVRNFSKGQITTGENTPLKMGGDYIRELNSARGGEISHACMPGCLIKCSNVYADKEGRELVSPLEYETIGLLGTNCGLTDPDEVAILNEIANDLGIDTIELGATLAVLMEAGEAEFGDLSFMKKCLADLREGNERGRFLANGTAIVGETLNVKRIPVIKRQAISAYDPRIIEVTAISMMVTAQGADHTTGNAPSFKTDELSVSEVASESFRMQVNSALADSLGLCVFGRSVTDENLELIANAINDAHGTDITPDALLQIATDTLKQESEFNRLAGFSEQDDELPAFFASEALEPRGKKARLFAAEVNESMRKLIFNA